MREEGKRDHRRSPYFGPTDIKHQNVPEITEISQAASHPESGINILTLGSEE